MSLALLLPDTPVLGSPTASPTSSPVAADSSGDAVSASALVFAGTSPGWDIAELKWKRGMFVHKVQLRRFPHIFRFNCAGNSYLYMDSPSGRLVSKQSGRMMM